jgi:hypothetical protein
MEIKSLPLTNKNSAFPKVQHIVAQKNSFLRQEANKEYQT